MSNPSTAPQHSFFYRLYTGTGAFDIVGRRRRYFLITGGIVVVALLSILLRGFSLGIDFEGGTRAEMPTGNATVEQVEETFAETLGFEPVTVQVVGSGATSSIQVRSTKLDNDQVEQLQLALFDRFQPTDRDGTPSITAISVSEVSETWGDQITEKALIALLVFIAVIALYITLRFEWDMAVAAIVALGFDLSVTAGVYSMIGFEVTPATVIGLLTILGFSLYDTVVVFDKVEENTRGVLETNRRTYAEQANLAVNQTIMRSINTTIIGVLPIVSLLVVAVWMLGVGTLKDLALVQMVGVIVGTFSSVFLATPLLVVLKQRRAAVKAHTQRVLDKRAGRTATPVAAAPAANLTKGIGAGVPAADQGSGDLGGGATTEQRRVAGPRPGARPTGKRRRT